MPAPSPALPTELVQQLHLADPANGAAAAAGEAAARMAMRLAQDGGHALQAGRAAAWLCTHLFRQGQHDKAQQEAWAALPLLDGDALVVERCETLRVVAISQCEQGRFGPALASARRLDREASAAGDAGLCLMAAYALGAVFDRMGDPWQASRVVQGALARHGAAASPRQQLIASIGLCAFVGDTFHRMRDVASPEERAEVLRQCRRFAERAVALLPGAPEPLFQVAALHNLGEALLYQSDLQAAQPLLQDSIRIARQAGLAAHHWRAKATQCQWWLASGRARQARDDALELLAEMGDQAAPLTTLRLHETAYQACKQLGDFEAALRHLEQFERIDRQRTLTELRAQSELFVTRIEAEQAQSQAALARDEAKLQSQRADEFAHQAEHDPLTGLGNRAHLDQWATARAERPGRPGEVSTLAMIDIDHFKRVNDQHGHAAGDAVLMRLAALLREGTRGSDVLVRLGGEEFVVVLPGTAASAAADVCERLRRRVADQSAWPELPLGYQVTVSMGLAESRGESLTTWLRRADRALYDAKHQGRNRIRHASDR